MASMNWGPAIGDLIGGKWRVIRTSIVHLEDVQRFYNVRHKDTGVPASCIAENTATDAYKWVELYVKCLMSIESPFLPGFIEFGHETGYDYVCTSPVGPRLKELRINLPPIAERQFSTYTCLHIGFESVCAVKEFHQEGFLMRAVTLNAFSVVPSSPRTLLMHHAEHWMPRLWRAFDGESAFPLRPQAPFRGTLEFSSVCALRFQDQTRLDDLWAWFYMLVKLTCYPGGLPWMAVPPEIEHDLYAKLVWVADQKEIFHEKPSELLRSSPQEYFEILAYLKSAPSSRPEYEPDYLRLILLLKKAMVRVATETGNNDPKLDWEEGGLYHNDLRHLMEW